MSEPTISDVVKVSVDQFATDAALLVDKASDALKTYAVADVPSGIGVSATLPGQPTGWGWSATLAPSAPDLTFTDPNLPDQVKLALINRFDGPPIPTANFGFTYLPSVPEPGALQNIDWGTAPTVTVPALPTVPTYTDPESVVLSNYVIPELPTINLPDVKITLPTADSLPTASASIDYQSVEFSSAELTNALAFVAAVLDGNMLVAQSVWDAMWSRVAGDLGRQAVGKRRQNAREWAKRGWEMPGNLARSRETEQEIQEQISAKAVEIGVQQAMQTREDYWKAVEVINTIVGLLGQFQNLHQERLLRTAITNQQAELAVLQAAVSVFNARVGLVYAEVQAKGLELRGELSKLEAYKSELEGLRILTEVDKTRVQTFVAQWEGIRSKVQAYTAQIEGVRTAVQAQLGAVQAYAETVRANQGIVAAWATEWEAYTRRLEPYRLQIQAFTAETSKYAQDVGLFSARSQGEATRITSDIAVERLALEEGDQQLKRYSTQWGGIDSKLKALTSGFDSQVRLFSAESAAEGTRVGALTEQYRAELQAASTDLNAKIESMKTLLGYWQVRQNAAIEWQKAVASTYAQVGAAQYSACGVHIGATSQVGYDYNMQYNQNLQRSYSVSVSADPASADTSAPIVPERIW